MHIVALMQQAGGYGVGVSDANTDLKQAVSEALATLTGNGTIGVIETKWLGTALDLSSTPLTAGATKSTDAGATVASKEPKDESEGENADGDAAPADEGTGAGDEVNAGENAVQLETSLLRAEILPNVRKPWNADIVRPGLSL